MSVKPEGQEPKTWDRVEFDGGENGRDVRDKYTEVMEQLKIKFETLLKDKVWEDGSLKQEIPSAEIPIKWIVNPLMYAWPQHKLYIRKMPSEVSVLFVGMNPSPFAPSGIPFGDEKMIRELFEIDISKDKLIGILPFLRSKPYVDDNHDPKDCDSGRRFWKFIKSHFKDIGQFRNHCFVINCSPLFFTGYTPNYDGPKEDTWQTNISLDNLIPSDNELVNGLIGESQRALKKAIELMEPKLIVAMGNYAKERVQKAIDERRIEVRKIEVIGIEHPSPRNDQKEDQWIAYVEDKIGAGIDAEIVKAQ